MIALLTVFCGVYFIFILTMNISWLRIPKTSQNLNTLKQVSVIVPMRNEASNITNVIEDIRKQDYPIDFLELIIVDDHSTDDSVSLVESAFLELKISAAVIVLANNLKGKKSALTMGIEKANGKIILTTDADCRLGTHWVSSIINGFDDNTELVFGPVQLTATTFFGRLQMIDFAALIGLGAATWNMGMAGMCNGANLAFTKATFIKCEGYKGTEDHPSGDDEFLLRKIKQQYPKGIKFVKDRAAVVMTEPMPSLNSFIQQRIRWAGKWKLHKDRMTKLMAVLVFTFYLLFLAVTTLEIINGERLDLLVALWCMKWLVDTILVGSVLRLTQTRLPLIGSIALSVLYPFYAIGIGLSTISYNFEWKDRKY